MDENKRHRIGVWAFVAALNIPGILKFIDGALTVFTAPSDIKSFGAWMLSTLRAVADWPWYLAISMSAGSLAILALYTFGTKGFVRAWRFVSKKEARQTDMLLYADRKGIARLDLAKSRLEEMRSRGLDAAAQLAASEQISRCKAFWQEVPAVPDPPSIADREAARTKPQGVGYFDFRNVKHAFRAINDHVSRIDQQIGALTQAVMGYEALNKRYSQFRVKWKPSQRLLESEALFYFPDDAARQLWLGAHRATDAFAKVRDELQQELRNIEVRTRQIAIPEQYLPRLPLDTE